MLMCQARTRLPPAEALRLADERGGRRGDCRQLDGLPLALELAALRVRILEAPALLQRLDHTLDLLTSGDRDLPLRQRTLRATTTWSSSLLGTDELLLRAVSAVALAAAARQLSERAGVVVAHSMDPGVVGRIEALKATIPKETLDEVLASGSMLSPTAALAMVSE